jgi:peptidoglycan endopeptidase LytE
MRVGDLVGRSGSAVILAALAASACGPVSQVARPSPFPRATRPAASDSAAMTEPSVTLPAPLARQILDTALALRGIAYRLGGGDPASGFDCSGLVQYVFAQHQLDVPRTVAEQFAAADDIAPDQMTAGDLLFFSTTGPGPTHVGIALGPLAQGEFVHAPGTGSVVRVERFDTPYWRARWMGAKRTPLTRR